MEKKEYPKDIGAVWVKQSSNGEYLSIQVEIDGVKHNFTAFANRFYEEGGKKPKFNIKPPRQPQDAASKTDAYQSRIDFVNAEKAKLAKQKAANNIGAMMEQAGLLTEDDLPF